MLLLLFLLYGLTFLVSLRVGRKEENVDGYMVSNNAIGFGMAAASMTATCFGRQRVARPAPGQA